MLKQKTLHQVIIFYVCFLAMQTDKRCTYMKNSLNRSATASDFKK